MTDQLVELRAPVRIDLDGCDELAAMLRVLRGSEQEVLMADLLIQGRPQWRWYAGPSGGTLQTIPPDAAAQHEARRQATAHLTGRLTGDAEPEAAMPV